METQETSSQEKERRGVHWPHFRPPADCVGTAWGNGPGLAPAVTPTTEDAPSRGQARPGRDLSEAVGNGLPAEGSSAGTRPLSASDNGP